MNELALFAGIGGGILGGILSGFRTICAVETNKYCQTVLLQRQIDKILPYFPIWDDVRTFDGIKWRGIVDIITAGFPCQPFSLAGKRLQENDERNMWPDTIRIIREVRPRFILLENVPGLLSSGYCQRIFTEITEAGYLFRWEIISAAEVGAPHLRKRLWITGVLSDTKSVNQGRLPFGEEEKKPRPELLCEDVSNSSSNRWDEMSNELVGSINRNRGQERKENSLENPGCEHGQSRSEEQGMLRRMHEDGQTCNQSERPDKTNNGWWSTEPCVGRVANGVPYRNDRLKAIGNAQVPRVAAEAWRRFII